MLSFYSRKTVFHSGVSLHFWATNKSSLEIIPIGKLHNCNYFIPQSLYYCGGPGERGLQISWSESEFFDKCLLRLWQYSAQCLGNWRQWLNNDSDKFFTRLSKLSRLVWGFTSYLRPQNEPKALSMCNKSSSQDYAFLFNITKVNLIHITKNKLFYRLRLLILRKTPKADIYLIAYRSIKNNQRKIQIGKLITLWQVHLEHGQSLTQDVVERGRQRKCLWNAENQVLTHRFLNLGV